MDKVIKNHLALIAVLLIGSFQAFAAIEAKPVYLSYEEKVLAGYALMADGKDATTQAGIVARAGNFISQNLAKPVTVEVRNFQEFLDHFRGDWPNSGSLEGDLQRIETLGVRGRITYTSRSLSVQRRIEAFQQSHSKFLETSGSGITQGNQGMAVEKVQNLIREQLENFNRIGEKVANVGMAGMKDVTTRIVLQTLFTEYYARQSVDSKKQMIMAMLNANLLMNDEAKLELMIQNSGPQFQKLLQVVARQGELPQELQSTFKKLESAVRAEPWWKVQEILTHEKANYSFTYFERKPLGVGTMAQVHRAKVLWNGQIRDVVARFIKPGIDLKVAEDHRILTEVSKIVDQNAEYRRNHGPLMTPLVQSITDTVLAELDQDATIERQITAKRAYDVQSFLNSAQYKNVIRFKVPEVLRAKNPSRLMVQEMVIGRSLDKEAETYKSTIPGLKKGIVEAMAKVWGREVMFGNGFYHSDLHQGNFLVRVMDDVIEVTILDFGMGGVLNEKMRGQVMLASIATSAKNAGLITDAFWDMSQASENKISKAELKTKIEAKLKQLARSSESFQFDKWTGWVSDQGIKIPYDLVNLSRGMIIMDNSLKEVGSKQDISMIQEDLAKWNAKNVVQGLKGTGLVTNKELAKAGYSILATKMAKPVTGVKSGIRCEVLF